MSVLRPCGAGKDGSGFFKARFFFEAGCRSCPAVFFCSAQKNRRDMAAKPAKRKVLFSLRPNDVFACKAHANHAPAVPCCHALCFRWISNALPRTAVFLRCCEEQKQTAGHERRTSKKRL